MRTVVEKQSIPFGTKRVTDSSLPKGTTKVRTRGVDGVKTLTYEVIFTNGVQTSKKLVRQEVTKQPVTQIIAVGTKVTQRCDPNYSWACVPIASDVDCAGGTGDGPAYVQGPVKVIGVDIYHLDNDGDGIGCEN
jgi:resuscitation-promoting factor RpfB